MKLLMARNPLFANTEQSTDRRSVFHNERDNWQSREQLHKRGCIHSAGISRKQEGVGRSDDKQEDEDLFDRQLISGQKVVCGII